MFHIEHKAIEKVTQMMNTHGINPHYVRDFFNEAVENKSGIDRYVMKQISSEPGRITMGYVENDDIHAEFKENINITNQRDEIARLKALTSEQCEEEWKQENEHRAASLALHKKQEEDVLARLNDAEEWVKKFNTAATTLKDADPQGLALMKEVLQTMQAEIDEDKAWRMDHTHNKHWVDNHQPIPDAETWRNQSIARCQSIMDNFAQDDLAKRKKHEDGLKLLAVAEKLLAAVNPPGEPSPAGA